MLLGRIYNSRHEVPVEWVLNLVHDICATTAPMGISCHAGHYIVNIFVLTGLWKKDLYTKQNDF